MSYKLDNIKLIEEECPACGCKYAIAHYDEIIQEYDEFKCACCENESYDFDKYNYPTEYERAGYTKEEWEAMEKGD